MRDLAPDIIRQRLLLEGYFTTALNETSIRRFLVELPAALDLRVYAAPTVFTPGGLGGHGNQGYDAFVPLIDSGISLYVWTAHRFLSLVLFTCKRFDVPTAVSFSVDFFDMTDVAHHEF